MADEQNKLKVIFLQKDPQGQRFGSGEWFEGTNVYVNNFRKKESFIVADVDVKTDETYVNKAGRVCNKHAVCGMMKLTPDECTIIVDLNGKKEKLTCVPRNVVGKTNGKPYIVLDFNGDSRVNPYENDLGFGGADIDDIDAAAEAIGL
jgi:hypothetical protein